MPIEACQQAAPASGEVGIDISSASGIGHHYWQQEAIEVAADCRPLWQWSLHVAQRGTRQEVQAVRGAYLVHPGVSEVACSPIDTDQGPSYGSSQSLSRYHLSLDTHLGQGSAAAAQVRLQEMLIEAPACLDPGEYAATSRSGHHPGCLTAE